MKNRRLLRNFILNRNQLRLVLTLSFAFLALYLIAAIFFAGAVTANISDLSAEYGNQQGIFFQKVVVLVQRSIFMLTFLGVVFSIIFLVIATALSHRIYGPVVKIRQFVKSIKAGEYSARVQLRTGDELHDLADELNEMAATVQKRHQE